MGRDANLKKVENWETDSQFCIKISLPNPQNGFKDRALLIHPQNVSNISKCPPKMAQTKSENSFLEHFPSYPGDLVTCSFLHVQEIWRPTGWEICSESRRLLDNPGELAYMSGGRGRGRGKGWGGVTV